MYLLPSFWRITLDEKRIDHIDNILDFIPLEDVLGEYKAFNYKCMLHLYRVARKCENYFYFRGIKNIKSPDKKDRSHLGITAIIGIDKYNLNYGFLLLPTRDKVIVLAIWPPQLAEAIRRDHEILLASLNVLFYLPDIWRKVYIFETVIPKDDVIEKFLYV